MRVTLTVSIIIRYSVLAINLLLDKQNYYKKRSYLFFALKIEFYVKLAKFNNFDKCPRGITQVLALCPKHLVTK